MESYIRSESYASVSQKTNWIQQIESKQENKYIELIEKLIRLCTSECPNFQERLRKPNYGTREESKRPETENEVKTENRLYSPTKISNQITTLLSQSPKDLLSVH